jgi:adenylosuccinate lyase
LFGEANRKIHQSMQALKSTLHQLALRYQATPIMARTHGMYAEKTSFGLRFALWFDDLLRLEQSFETASKGVEICKLSGSIGTYAILPPEHEAHVAHQLGLKVTPVHTQIVQRDRHSTYVNALALLASWIEKVVLDIRLLSRSDVGEVSEGFTSKQKGSSAMPHKKNPIKSENLTGLARLMRSYAHAAMENQALWHERDISHSSVERVVFMDATTLLDYMLLGLDQLLTNLDVFPEVMQRHIDESYDVWMSQYVLHTCIVSGFDREEAYRHLQTLSFQAIQEKQSLLRLLKQHAFFANLPWKTLEKDMDPLKNIATLYQRVFG